MIYGVGTDIVAVARIQKMYADYGAALARRVLSEQEWGNWVKQDDAARFLAKRFAAKEAFAKAVGTGIRPPVSFRHISVCHDALGKPEFVCAPELQVWLSQRGITRVHLSLRDERDYVVAFTLAQSD